METNSSLSQWFSIRESKLDSPSYWEAKYLTMKHEVRQAHKGVKRLHNKLKKKQELIEIQEQKIKDLLVEKEYGS